MEEARQKRGVRDKRDGASLSGLWDLWCFFRCSNQTNMTQTQR